MSGRCRARRGVLAWTCAPALLALGELACVEDLAGSEALDERACVRLSPALRCGVALGQRIQTLGDAPAAGLQLLGAFT